MKQHKWQPLNDDEISEILDKHGFNEVQIAGEYIDIVKLIRDVEKTHGIKPQPKEPQYLYVWNVFSKIVFTQDKNGVAIDTWDPKVLPKYIGKIKLEVEDE